MKDLSTLKQEFLPRHIGPGKREINQILNVIGASSLSQLIDETIPKNIRSKKSLDLPASQTELEFLTNFKAMMGSNKTFRSFIGMGYHDCIVPPVIQRNILENPAWYTAYTPYQAEIAQGRLEALINFQTMITDLTGMELANASLLDEATAAAEAMSLLYRVKSRTKKKADTFFIDKKTFPHTIELIIGRAKPIGINIIVGDIATLDISDPKLFGILLQYPDSEGAITDPSPFITEAQKHDVKIAVASDLMALTHITSPGEMGADVVVGTSQRFGVPLGYGGPHAAYFATKEAYKRHIPGRIIGVTEDSNGQPAYRMALQTREQHIKREKATSNICTAQVLLAVMAGMYAVYHGKDGLYKIANRIHLSTSKLNKELKKLGYTQTNKYFFDTLKIEVENKESIKKLALDKEINFRYFDDNHIGISLHEKTTITDLEDIIEIFAIAKNQVIKITDWKIDDSVIPPSLQRTASYLEHPVFNSYQTEHEILRYLKRLENKDLSLVHSMIALGSCTMKLNATTEMIPLSWDELANIHPFVPTDQAKGYHQMFEQLAEWLAEITGLYTTSLQPNSGAQGELAGLMVIKAYFEDNNQSHRNVTLIPSSAHGTNPASAIMAGQKVIIVACKENGDIDIDDLRNKAEEYKDNLMALMVTYPSTHGVFEENIKEACEIIHTNGGKVYLDGANLNAQVGLTSPEIIGADVCHLNLHKTFCIPHGGGGPGMGPIAVSKELAPFIPGNAVVKNAGGEKPIAAISAAPWGSASILSISYAYIALMGSEGLTSATETAILNANYIKERIVDHYPILFTGENGRNAHELIIDCRAFKEEDITVTDIAKRLMDYGFHAPTVSFPVAGTIMIEPTESESIEELDRFIDAMISIRNEIREIEDGIASRVDNVLKNAPHTMEYIAQDNWDMPYSRTKAAFPLPHIKNNKFWPSVGRVNDAHGDRNLMCTCLPVSAYEEELIKNTEITIN
ncbi:aminomethyl-transferring glycine dehydrogenase [Aquimarina sediminis]|uniref:aminomethyl-transferring glycine dehydrogenase n=1 Tax=Aquimarina sediminis TaxID=2070536 RepID=UPI000CA08FE5|nr:aminomethyl-transferring glycine dehydrogenase [Aquimarina sediminis]